MMQHAAAKKTSPTPTDDPIMEAFLRAPVDLEDETPEQLELIMAGERLPKVSGSVVSAEIAARRCKSGEK